MLLSRRWVSRNAPVPSRRIASKTIAVQNQPLNVPQNKQRTAYYEASGDGPPIVFVSGWAMSCECWRPAVAMLKRRHRCLIYDSRGFGRSQPSAISASFTIEEHAEDLHTLLEAAEIFDATIVGHELGSLIAAVDTDRHPQDTNS
jgi:pimeloyl-ACP methyl ester carboxylesterase